MTKTLSPWVDDIIIAFTTKVYSSNAIPAPRVLGDAESVTMSASKTFAERDKSDGIRDSNFFVVWAMCLILVTLAVITIVSNGTILTMFVLRKSLRKCKNIYIASLAAADLGIGFIVPVAVLEQIQSAWTLQGIGCQIYLTLRCSLLYVSLLSILLITVDRWWSIHYPFSYRVRQSKRMAACAVLMIWVASFALHTFSVAFWDHIFASISIAQRTEDLPGLFAFSHPSSSSSPLSIPASSLFMSKVTTFGTYHSANSEPQNNVVYHHLPRFEEKGRHEGSGMVGPPSRCELPYAVQFSFVLTVSVVQYFFPLLALWVLNFSLYFKITRRKSIKIRRSLSVNENYVLTFRKSSSESESSPLPIDSDAAELCRADNRQRLLAAARTGRRHTLAFLGLPFRANGLGGSGGGGGCAGGAGSVYFPSQTLSSQAMMNRRVSLHDVFPGIGNIAAWAGAVPNCPRMVSSQRHSTFGLTSLGVGLSTQRFFFGSGSVPLAGSMGSRTSACSIRKQSDDLVKEMLVRQDKKAARCLGLLVTVFTICWLPYTVVAVLRANSPELVVGWVRDLVFWVLLTNSSINPFLYGLLNAEFRKILSAWFSFPRRKKYRTKQALLYCKLAAPNLDMENIKDSHHNIFMRPVKERDKQSVWNV